MLDIALNLLYVGIVVATKLVATGDVPLPPRNEVIQVEFRPAVPFWSASADCRYTGVMVPYARDWEEVVDNGYVKTTLPAEPDKIAGYAILINKKSCPGQTPEAMFTTATWAGGFLGNVGITKGVTVTGNSVSKEVAMQPKWLPQALATIEKATETSTPAKAFLADLPQSSEAMSNN